MGKQNWKPGNMLNPVPAVMVSVTDKAGNNNIITVAWAGTVCTNPPMLSISVRPERFSYNMIKETGEFVVNLTTEELLRACDYCGVKSGRDVDKYAVRCQVRSESTTVIDLTLSVATKEQAEAICSNWKNQNEDVYAYLMDMLLR